MYPMGAISRLKCTHVLGAVGVRISAAICLQTSNLEVPEQDQRYCMCLVYFCITESCNSAKTMSDNTAESHTVTYWQTLSNAGPERSQYGSAPSRSRSSGCGWGACSAGPVCSVCFQSHVIRQKNLLLFVIVKEHCTLVTLAKCCI